MPTIVKLESHSSEGETEPCPGSSNREPNHGTSVFWFITLLTLTVVLFCAYEGWRQHALQTSPTTTQAIINRITIRHAKHGDDGVLWYTYEVNGKPYEGDDTVPLTFSSERRVGDSVRVAYLSNHPEIAMCLGYRPDGGWVLLAVLYAFLSVFGVVGLVVTLLSSRKARRTP